MSIQVYEDPSQQAASSGEGGGAIVILPNGLQITEEEHEKRIKDAEILEEKLKFITEKVPTRIMNISGSNAGAGSGEFHMYRMARRREQMRLSRIDELQKEEEAEKALQEKREKLQLEDDARTAKRRAQRQKKKQKKRGRMSGSELQLGRHTPEGEDHVSEEEEAAQPDLD